MPSPREAYSFTLILAGLAEPTDEAQGALLASGCDDALFGSRDGTAFLDFDREARSLSQAIRTAIENVEGAGFRVERVEPDALVSTAEIARRLGRTRETVRLYAKGQRGPGGFPAPVVRIGGRTPLYRWSDVVAWRSKAQPGEVTREEAIEVEAIELANAVLRLRNLAPQAPSVIAEYRSLIPRETFKAGHPKGASKATRGKGKDKRERIAAQEAAKPPVTIKKKRSGKEGAIS